ncbi:N-acetyltransferase ESCO2 isoform X1 [Anolis carolinensis]|uniref:N-acetyltransferase ESCO2 isoform X1 n=2 Tax=Anolis carolinensis TaxID=28377 RepID=UPI002F2B7418
MHFVYFNSVVFYFHVASSHKERHFTEDMAAVTPRKRKRSSDGLQLTHGNPVKKLMMEFTQGLPAVKVFWDQDCASPIKQTSAFLDNDKENHFSPQRSAILQKLDISPLQTANVPQRRQTVFPQKTSPESGTKCSSVVPAGSFYNKGKQFLNILERKLANESQPLGLGNDSGDLPVTSKTETAQVKMPTARMPSSKTYKRPAASKQPKALPKNTKKAKLEISHPKPFEGKENANCPTEKKIEGSFKVLSMKFKPTLKLQTGAAFFTTGKKGSSASKKGPSSPLSSPSVSKAEVKEKPESLLKQSKLTLPTKNKPTEAGRKGNCATEIEKEEKPNHVGKDEVQAQSTSQDLENVSESSLLDTEPQTPQSVGLKVLDLKEIEATNQDLEEMPKQSPIAVNKDENTSSTKPSIESRQVSALAYSAHPLCSTPFSNKKRSRTHPDEQPILDVGPGVQNIPAIPRTSKKSKELSKGLKDQMVIDAGQKHFGATVCKSCGMVYSAANPEDEAHHIQYHQRLLEGIKYVNWKNEHVAAEFWDGKIVLIRQSDPKYATKKAEDVRQLVDSELGFKQVVLTCPTQIQTYLFVSNEKKIIGCLIAEPVRRAFRVLSEPTTELDSPNKSGLEPQRVWCCSTEPENVFCGISRIWVFSLMRRKRVASRMVDVLRRTFCFGSYLSTDEIAFSDPTPDGKVFAIKYCQTPNFLVYNFLS